MASAADVESRLKASLKTPTGSFSQVIAVTQGAINLSLYMLFDQRPELAEINIKSRNGEMNGVLTAGKVSLPVEGNNLGTVYYYCIFESGKVKLWDDELDDWTQWIDMKDWCFAFAVDMGRINLPEDSDEYDKVKEVINQPGEYSITRLYLDFNTHQIANFSEKLSSFNGREWKNSSEKNYFISMMLKWGDPSSGKMGDPKSTTVGYAAATKNPAGVNGLAPTFPPTSLIFQRYSYMPPGEQKPHSGLNEQGNKNMLLYLEMTENRPFPQERLLTYTGNFAIPGMSGSICISKVNFWNNFLLRGQQPGLQQLLRIFNEATFGWVRGVTVEYNGVSGGGTTDYGVGPGSGLDTAKDFYAWQEDGVLSWKWGKKDYKKADKGWGFVFDATMEMWTETNNKLTITAGTNIARVSGTTRLATKLNTHSLGIGEGFEAVATMNWGTNITLNSVLNGGLEISLNLPSNTSEAFHVSTYNDSWPLDIHDRESKKLKDSLVNSINRSPFQQAQNVLQTALKSTARFVLPGAKTFSYKNAMYNRNGDVLLELKYDGVS